MSGLEGKASRRASRSRLTHPADTRLTAHPRPLPPAPQLRSETFLYNGVEDLTSAIFAFDSTTGLNTDQHRFKRDMFNSAPLVATGSDGAVRVYVSTTLGAIFCYAPGALAGGPLWVSQDLPPIPTEDLPATTYTFLSVTQKGTLLATSTAGGAKWQTQKATFAIVNGLLSPQQASAAAASGALSPPAAAGVSSAVILLGAFGAWVAYGRVAGFRSAVDSAVASAKGAGGVRDWAAANPAAGKGGPNAGSSLLRAPGASASSYSAVSAPVPV